MAPGVNAWPPKVVGTGPGSLEDLLEQPVVLEAADVTTAAWNRMRAPYSRNALSQDSSVSPCSSYRSGLG
jgi:hypothetical protein